MRLIWSLMWLKFSPWWKFWFSHHFGNQVSLWFRFTLKEISSNKHFILSSFAFRYKKCTKSHEQSQITSKFLPTSVRDIFKQSNLIGHGSQILQDFRRQFCGNFSELTSPKRQSRKNGPFRGNFLGKFRYKSINFALIWQACLMFLTEIIIYYSNNKALKKWANGKVFNIMTSAQFFHNII